MLVDSSIPSLSNQYGIPGSSSSFNPSLSQYSKISSVLNPSSSRSVESSASRSSYINPSDPTREYILDLTKFHDPEQPEKIFPIASSSDSLSAQMAFPWINSTKSAAMLSNLFPTKDEH
ncbi:hypothetical protein SAY87_018818 [Trapa incisa]|uniref:Uncharacterized protein n=1 Tax=Trapa incisa TaxID=236973 RepID=A0AAN7Q0Q0_9MYRT|nr:hypothetical protein SAY87_018818 [Trapa incisa]